MISPQIKNAYFPTAYLPPVEYFVFLLSSENIYIETRETYPKQTYRNRCYVYGSNGVESLHVPVIKPTGKQSKTNEVLISYSEQWQRNHWRAICTAYSNAPFFIYYKDFLKPFYNNRFDKLLDLNNSLLNSLMSEIGIAKSLGFAGQYEKNVLYDFREAMTPKTSKGNLLPTMQYPYYEQVFCHKYGFRENLSIIDLLFNKGPDTMEYLEECAGKINFSFQKDKLF